MGIVDEKGMSIIYESWLIEGILEEEFSGTSIIRTNWL